MKAHATSLSATLTDQQAIEKLFGAGTHITMDDINNADNYVMPAAGTYAARSPSGIAEAIAKLAIELQVLFELDDGLQGNGFSAADVAKVIREKLYDGYDKATDLGPGQTTVANARIAEAEQRGAGEPFANPDITRGANTSDSTNEDTAITIDVAD